MTADRRRQQRIDRMHRLRDRVAEWSARHWPERIEQGMRCWLGHHEPTDHLVFEAISFALIAPAAGEPSLLARFRIGHDDLPRADRVILDAWSDARFGLYEVVGIDPGVALQLDDVMTGRQVRVVEKSASAMLGEGTWLAAFVMPVDHHHELEGTSAVVPPTTRIDAVLAFRRALEEQGLDPTGLGPEGSRRCARPVIRALRKAQRPPRLVNHDDHPIAPTSARLDLAWSELLAAASAWGDTAADDEQITFLGRHEPALGGAIALGTVFARPGGAVSLEANSEQRFADLHEVLEERLGRTIAISQRTVQSVPSDPEGRTMRVDSSYQEGESAEQVSEAWQRRVVGGWADQPVPALDDRTPREAAQAGRIAEVRALIPDAFGPEVAERLRRELGIPGS